MKPAPFRSILEVDVSVHTYIEKFKTLLWVEEIQMEIDIRRYDLVGVAMEMEHNLLILEVTLNIR